MQISDELFAQLIADAMDALPEKYAANMDNVAVVYEDEPTPEQRKKLAMRYNDMLFGLYEGIPLTQRGAAYNMVLPDKITIFKNPLVAISRDLEHLREEVRHTLWHEVAHHFGLDHLRIHELDERRRAKEHGNS